MRRLAANKVYSFALLAGAMAMAWILFAGCSSPSAPPPAPAKPQPAVQQPVSAPTKTAAPKTEQPQEPVFTYNPAGRRDPFTPLILREEAKKRDANRPPLERYEIGEFKLSGIIWGGFGYNAILEGPDGKGYFIRVGSIVGPNRGVVKKITQSSIIIEEKYKNFLGETERKEIVVELPKKQEGIL